MVEFPLSEAPRRRLAFDFRYGFLAVFVGLFVLNGGPMIIGPTPQRTEAPAPLLDAQLPPPSNAATAQELDRPTIVKVVRVMEPALAAEEMPSFRSLGLRPELPPEPDAIAPEPPEPPPAPSPALLIPLVDEPGPAPAQPLTRAEGSSLSRVAGRWAPYPDGCTRGKAAGLLPLQISRSAATAGGSTCRFLKTQPDKGGFRIVAKCAGGGERWTANVRLSVGPNRLTWSSERGTQQYQRCSGAMVARRG